MEQAVDNGVSADRAVDACLDDDGRITIELRCRECQYDLRRMRLQGTCPECGTPVGRSVHDDLLIFNGVRWIQRVRLGGILLLIGIGLSVLITVGWWAALLAFPNAVFGSDWPFVAMRVVNAAAVLVSGAAYWLLTTPEAFSRGRWDVRRWARLLLIVGVVLDLAPELITLVDSWILLGLIETVAGTELLRGILLADSIMDFVGTALLFVHVRGLALRLPNASLARRTRIVMCGILSAVGLVLLWQIVWVAMLLISDDPFEVISRPPFLIEGIMMVIHGLAGVTGFVFGIWLIFLAFRFIREFGRLSREANALDMASPPPESV